MRKRIYIPSPTVLKIKYFKKRSITTTSINMSSKNNDQDRLIKEIELLEQEFNDLDRDVEVLAKNIQESEELIDEENEQTGLSEYIEGSILEKDNLVGENMQERDNALFNKESIRQDKSLFLKLVKISAKKDIEVLETINGELPELDPASGDALSLIKRLEVLSSKSSRLEELWHENDLPPISKSDGPEYKPQDSSDVHQTDFTSFDPFDE